MKMSRFAIAAAVAAIMAGQQASAQQYSVRSAAHRPLVTDTETDSTYRDISYAPKEAEPPSPSDEPMQAAAAACTTCEGDDTTYLKHHGLFGRCLCCPAPEEADVCDLPFCKKWYRCCGTEYQPTRFFNQNPCRKIKFDGYMNGGYVWNPYRPADKFNGPYTWMDRANEGNLQEMWMNAHKDVEMGDGFDWGFQSTMVYGTNSRFITAAGFEDMWNKSQAFYGLAMPNFNTQVAYNDLKLTIGRFVSPVGYYTVGQGNNFFNNIPYTYQYGEVFTQTGMMAQYQMTDDLNVGGGFSYGWDNWDHRFNKTTSPFGIITRNNLLKCGDSLAYFVMYSHEPTLGPGDAIRNDIAVPAFKQRYLQTLVYSRPLTEKWNYVLQSDLGQQQQPFGPGTRPAWWYGLNNYWYYKVNNCLSYGINAEWFRDDGGFRVGGFLPNFPNNNYGGPTSTRGLSPLRSGYNGSFYRLMAGANYKPHPNLLLRSALVFDWYSGQAGPNGLNPATDINNSLPFINGSAPSWSQVLLANDVVFYF